MKIEKLNDPTIQDHWIIYIFHFYFHFPFPSPNLGFKCSLRERKTGLQKLHKLLKKKNATKQKQEKGKVEVSEISNEEDSSINGEGNAIVPCRQS